MRVPFDGPPTRMTPFVTDIFELMELKRRREG